MLARYYYTTFNPIDGPILSMRVVLVDPSRTTLKFIARMLEARRHQVHCFTDGRAALDFVKADLQVGAVITSAELESMSGFEVCWETRLIATPQRPIYVILMTSVSDKGRLIEALDSGADDLIGRPPVAEELYARLRAAERFAAMQAELIRLATTDSLTGLTNRRAFFEKAKDICTHARAGEPICAVMIDIDNFKQINDVHGHDMGDRAICSVAEVVMRERALVGRLGGEEFALLLDHCRLPEAVVIAERVRNRISLLRIKTDSEPVTLTCSFGVSQWLSGDSIDLLLRRADMALYEAKIGGRNRVVAAGQSIMETTLLGAGRHIRAERKSA